MDDYLRLADAPAHLRQPPVGDWRDVAPAPDRRRPTNPNGRLYIRDTDPRSPSRVPCDGYSPPKIALT